ncbi:hypothetical protein HSIEG1_3757 [Enterococcus sp. HSIEG1]|jgi:hypothetical protein|nr:hypothetical protein HSIEG1_3757 [Enterococcus sp. HSIEG1]OJG50831.1 hypothetical protein RV03_GL001112 [Enterococcus gallinarum]
MMAETERFVLAFYNAFVKRFFGNKRKIRDGTALVFLKKVRFD